MQRKDFLTFALALALLVPAVAVAHPPDAGTVETVVLFNQAALETPESIAIDRRGNLYVSLALAGEVRKIAPDGTQSTLVVFPIGPPVTFCGPFFNAVTGIALDRQERYLYASVVSCELENRGVWRVSLATGEAELLAPLPLASIPNGIAWYRREVYVADSTLGLIWRVPEEGGAAEVWIDDPLLDGVSPFPGAPAAGANGLQIFRNEVYVANASLGTIVVIPIEPDGSAGEPRIHATLPTGLGCDDFALDVHGAIYCGTGPTNTLLRIDPDGSTEILLTAADGLDGPTAAAFGRRGRDRFNLYIANASFPFLPSAQRPSVMSLHLGTPGAPPSW